MLAVTALMLILVYPALAQAQPPAQPVTAAPATSTPMPGQTVSPQPIDAEGSDELAAVEVTPEVTEVVCPGVPATRLVPGERGRVSVDDPRPLNIRSGPGTSNPVVGQIPARGIFFVIEGPRCSQRYAWYRVSYREGEDEDAVITGWIAEGDANGYFVEVYPPGW